MFPTDYIMRIIEQFVQALVSIVKLRKSGKHEEAISHIQTASRYFLKTNLFFLTHSSPEKIFEPFKSSSGEIDTERCVLCADLLYELALINEAEKKNADPIHLKIVCLNLYCYALPREKQFQTNSYFEKVTDLTHQLKDQILPENVEANHAIYQKFINEHRLKSTSH